MSFPANDGHNDAWTYTGSYHGTPAAITNVPPIKLPLGLTNLHVLIEIPAGPPIFNSNFVWQTAHLYHASDVIVLVSNTSVTLKVQAALSSNQLPGQDPNPLIRTFTNLASISAGNNLPFLQLTNRFFDQREMKTNLPADINIGLLKLWLATNVFVQSKTAYPATFYVANNQTYTSQQLPVVRLTNGRSLPENGGLGFSVVTPNPLYVWGHYNQTNNAYLGTTNTSNGTVPAALISDALTILSGAWTDSNSLGASKNNPSSRNALDTTVNAAIITGSMPTTGPAWSEFSGGVQNLPRLLEDWSGRTLSMNTSFIRLFSSTQATNQFRNPVTYLVNGQTTNPYYNPPTRNFNYDLNLSDITKTPPGTLIISVIPPAD